MAITMTGTSGIDVSTIISQLTAIRQQEVTRITDRRTTVNRQLDAFSRMGSQLNELQTRAAALSNVNSFNQFRATSSNDSAVGITTSGSSVSAGFFSVQVTQLAQREKLGSSGEGTGKVEDTNAALNMSGTFSINGVEIEVRETDTLNDLRTRINNATSTDADGNITRTNVMASVIRAGDGDFRLVLTNNDGGAAGIDIDDVSGNVLQNLGFLDANGDKATPLVAGQDAIFSINGINMTSNSNTVSDRINGMTFELKEITTAPVNINVSRDDQAITNNVEQLIQTFNAMLRFERDNTGFTPGVNGADPTRGALFGDSTVRNVNQSLRAIFQQTVNFNGQQVSLAHFGITTNPQTGDLQFDKDKFGEMLRKDFDGVVSVFATSGVSSNDRISLGRNTGSTQEGTYELREFMGTRQVPRMTGAYEDDGITPLYKDGERVMVQAKDGDDLLWDEEPVQTFQIRLLNGGGDWVTGTRNGEVVTFSAGPAAGMSITAPIGSSGGVDGEISTLTFSRGLAGAVETRVRQLTDSVDGVIVRKRESLNSRIRNIDNQVDMAQRRVDAYNARLVMQFARMEQTMLLLNSQQSAMFAQLPQRQQQ